MQYKKKKNKPSPYMDIFQGTKPILRRVDTSLLRKIRPARIAGPLYRIIEVLQLLFARSSRVLPKLIGLEYHIKGF